MRTRLLGALLVMLSVGLSASAQTSDPTAGIEGYFVAGSGQSGGILQGIIGNDNGTGKKTDKKLETPETIQPPENQDLIQKNIKTRDGRILRQLNEDPELRADDTVMIEIEVDRRCLRP